MVSLDEDYLGWATDALLVRGLKVCGGLLCHVSNNRLVGAHFTNITTAAEIYTACQHLVNHMLGGGTVARMYFIYNMTAWGHRNDKYASALTLISDLKILMHYNGVCRVYDKNIIGASVDVKLSRPGGNLQLETRVTPVPDLSTNIPNSNVKRVRTQFGSNTPGILAMDNVYTHKLPTTRGGFKILNDSLFAQI